MNRLGELIQRLAAVARRRRRARWAIAIWDSLLGLLWALWAIGTLDALLELTRAQRLLAWLGILGVLGWHAVRFQRPMLRRRETTLDLALELERVQGIDSDLVAALQFESSNPTPQTANLRRAVVDYVADYAEHLKDLGLRSPLPWRGRALALGATVLLLVGLWGLQPELIPALARRLAFSEERLPTATRILEVRLNGRLIDWNAPRSRVHAVFAGVDQWLQIRAARDVDVTGHVDLVPHRAGRVLRQPLSRNSRDSSLFRLLLKPLTEPTDVRVVLGDATSSSWRLLPVAAPNLELTWSVDTATRPDQDLSRQTFASSVMPKVEQGQPLRPVLSAREGALSKAVLYLDGAAFECRASDVRRRAWRLAGTCAKLDDPRGDIAFSWDVTDQHGLTWKNVRQGVIQVVPDQLPTVMVRSSTHEILPHARPTIEYRAFDDHGLTRLRLHVSVLRADGQPRDCSLELPVGPVPCSEILGRMPLDLRDLHLLPRDRVLVRLEATDLRRSQSGRDAISEPLSLAVIETLDLPATASQPPPSPTPDRAADGEARE